MSKTRIRTLRSFWAVDERGNRCLLHHKIEEVDGGDGWKPGVASIETDDGRLAKRLDKGVYEITDDLFLETNKIVRSDNPEAP